MTNTVVFSFARMNPPTIGHQRLVECITNTAQAENADHVLFLSQTSSTERDPLCWEPKLHLVKQLFPVVHISDDASIRTPFEALEHLGKSYDKVIMVVGSDRVFAFSSRMEAYISEWGISDFSVMSAGDRTASDDVSSASASAARLAVANGQIDQFAAMIPSDNTEIINTVYNTIKTVYEKTE